MLGAFIPEFGRIVAMMQFNMYHHYTVDEHTIRADLDASARSSGASSTATCRSRPRSSPRASNRRVLYVALLLHDIGKGSGRDHSEVGAEIAARLCPRLGLDAEETELVVWLVRHHLLMSDVAQKRDLAEPRTVRDFAAAVKSPTRLKLLLVLTVCDIRGVGPNVWNNWKAMLLRSLYAETLEFLTGGSQAQGRPEREAAAREALAAALADWPEAEVRAECARHYAPYWLGFDTRTHAIFARPRAPARRGRAGDARRARLRPRRHPGLLRHVRPPGHLRPARRRAGAVRRQRGRRAHLHHHRRHRHRRLLDPGRRGQALRARTGWCG